VENALMKDGVFHFPSKRGLCFDLPIEIIGLSTERY